MSRVLPNAMVAQAFRKLGIRNEFLEADLPPMVDLGLQKLYGFQHNDGGWGWWYDDSTDVNQTAYVLLGLAMTEQGGFDVDDGVLDRGADALRAMLPDADPRAQAYGAFVLTMAGQPVSITLTLTDALELDLFSQAALAIALDATGNPTLTAALVDNLHESAIQDATTVHWADEGDHVVYSRKVMGSTVRTTAMVVDALARLDPSSGLLPKAVRWLMAQRHGQGWGDTQKTSFAILALSDFLLATREQAAGSAYQVYVNGELWREGTLEQPEVSETLVLTYVVAAVASEPVAAAEVITVSEAITTSEDLTPGEAVTPTETITTSEVVTTGEAITVSVTVTSSEAITSSETVTPSETITPSEAITVSATVTSSEAITASGTLTASEAIATAETVTATESITPSLLHPGENQIVIVLGAPGAEPTGRIYYALTLAAQRAPADQEIQALLTHDRSITVEREYRLQGSKAPATEFQRGDLVEVRLTLDAPEESWYIVVDDPLPAGFEALNERLGTTSHIAQVYEEPVYYWERYGYNRKDVRDDRVSFFITRLEPGERTLIYLMRATTSGAFVALPTQVYPMYEPEVWSRSDSARFRVRPR